MRYFRKIAKPLPTAGTQRSVRAQSIHPATRRFLYSFTGGADGGYPLWVQLARDSASNLYGTTAGGGTAGVGVVFKVDKSGNETVLHSFTGGADGGHPTPA